MEQLNAQGPKILRVQIRGIVRVTHNIITVLDSSLARHYPFTWNDLWITRFRVLIPSAASLTCHNKHADLRNFDAFFLVRSVGHASACVMFQGFSQDVKRCKFTGGQTESSFICTGFWLL